MRSRPLMFDMFAGLGGATEGFLAEGWRCIGIDNERHMYGDQRYPAQLWLQDILTIDGAQLRHADFIWASPPCQTFSWMAMPWSKAKQIQREYQDGTRDRTQLTALFDACFRIQREACEAAGRHIPLVVENVRGAQKWVGRARWNYGSFYLWGDVPALMPMVRKHVKVAGFRFDGSGKSFQSASVEHVKVGDGNSYRAGTGPSPHFTNRAEHRKNNGGSWFNIAHNTTSGSKSGARKAASAAIAKIPFVLAQHIARTYRPRELCL